jgi:hypothetical protein
MTTATTTTTVTHRIHGHVITIDVEAEAHLIHDELFWFFQEIVGETVDRAEELADEWTDKFLT